VAAELCRKGLAATTFTRNMPGFDILATQANGAKTLKLQVKTIERGAWGFDADDFLEIAHDPETKAQRVGGHKPLQRADFYILVKLGGRGADRFFILTHSEFVQRLQSHYEAFLTKHDAVRPRNARSTHCALQLEQVSQFERDFGFLQAALK